MKPVKIIYQNRGKAPTRHGILIKDLRPIYIKILERNKYLKNISRSEDSIKCIFALEIHRSRKSRNTRAFINPKTKTVDKYDVIYDQLTTIDWNCSYCNADIKSKVGEINNKNLTCTKCFNYYLKGSDRDRRKMVDSAIEFTDYCKELYLARRKKIIRAIKQNAKIDL